MAHPAIQKKALQDGDVPAILMHGKKKWPLGRYLRRKLREFLKWTETGTPESALESWTEELKAMFAEEIQKEENLNLTWAQIMQKLKAQECRNMEAQAKIREAERCL